MTTPDGYKSSKFSADVHSQLMALARELDGTADDALRHLLGMSTLRVEVSDTQRRRWTEAATEQGMDTAEFVRTRVESSLLYCATPAALYGIYTGVYELCRKAGLNPPLIDPRTAPTRPAPPTAAP